MPNFRGENSNLKLETSIIKIVTNEKGRPIPAGIILGKLEKENGRIDKHNFYNTVDKLIKQNDLIFIRGKLVLGYINAPINYDKTYEGTISINTKLSGFVTLDNKKKAEFFVHEKNINGALNGDRVKVALMEKPPKIDLQDAVVVEIVKHGKDFYVGTFFKDGDGYKIEVDDSKMYLKVILDSTDGLVNGNKILFKISRYESDKVYATVSRIIGHSSDVGADILSIVYNNGLEPEFSEDIVDYTKSIKVGLNPRQRSIRKDLSNLDIVTIDPATSKDFDDAIYVKKNSDKEFLLSVSIADVSHYVEWKSILDESTFKRGCSVYLVDRVIPMLPHNLSDDVCSLNPGEERLTLTCDMVIDNNGNFKDIKVYPSIIKSHRRFSYDEVNAFFNKKDNLSKDTSGVKEMLNDANTLHNILTKYKNKRGYIEFNIPEPKIIVDKSGEVTDIVLAETGEAQKMIEDFMVAANEAVTIYAEKRNWPFIYRVHAQPEIAKLEMFSMEAKKLNFKITSIEDVKPNTISKWLEMNKTNPNLDLISVLLLRSMAKAEYSTKNIGHFGLASTDYTHFTSPIRRYSDLIIHRIYWMYEFQKEMYTDGQRKELASQLNEISKQSSMTEVIAVNTERDVNDIKFAQYMFKHIGEEFTGKVVTVSSFGMFVELENTIGGLIKISNMGDDFYNFNQGSATLTGSRKGLIFSLGTKIKVKVINANKITGKIEFSLVEHLGNR